MRDSWVILTGLTSVSGMTEDEQSDPLKRAPKMMPRDEALEKLHAHNRRVHDKAAEQAEQEAVQKAASAPPAGPPLPPPVHRPLPPFDTARLVHHANALGDTLDELDRIEDDERHADEVIARGIEEAIDALSTLAEQPFVTDPERFGENVGLPLRKRESEAPDLLLTEVRDNPEEFAEIEARMVADAGVAPAPTARIQKQLIRFIIDTRESDSVHIDVHVTVAPDAVDAAVRRLRAEKESPKGRKRKIHRILRAFEAIAGAVLTVVDVPVVATGVGVVSIAFGAAMVLEGVNRIVDDPEAATA